MSGRDQSVKVAFYQSLIKNCGMPLQGNPSVFDNFLSLLFQSEPIFYQCFGQLLAKVHRKYKDSAKSRLMLANMHAILQSFRKLISSKLKTRGYPGSDQRISFSRRPRDFPVEPAL